MPYDSVVSGFSGGGGGGGGYCSPLRCCYTILVIIIVTGIICIGSSIRFLIDGIANSRGKSLGKWDDAIISWNNQGLLDFQGLDLNLGSNGTQMDFNTGIITPRDFGESSWSNGNMNPPSQVTSAYYSAPVCQNSALNQVCTFKIYDKAGRQLVQRSLTPNSQTVQRPQSFLCSWYDGDYRHPMATVGMGQCNSIMAGGSQTYDYGPSLCVEQDYLDAYGCPNDQLLQTTMISWGWGIISTYLESKPRFTYEDGKCWDYTDCYCKGCGFTFKTDVSRGYYFTGYGYYYRNRWYSFNGQDKYAKLQMCANTFNMLGFRCPYSSIDLVCFRAGGYPKKSCQQYCGEKGGDYTPQPSHPPINSYYRPYGSTGPSPTYNIPPATCTYTENTQTTRLDLALGPQNMALSSGSRWSNGKFTEATVVVSNTPQPVSSVQVTVRSSAGPVMEGLTITNGCGPKVSGKPGNQCFGLTVAQNMLSGIALMITGIILLLCPIVSCVLVCMGLISCLNNSSGGGLLNMV